MTDYEKQAIGMLRSCFPRPRYFVYRIEQKRKNEAGLLWNLDFCVTIGGSTLVAIFKLLREDTTLSNLDQRMRDAYAIFSLDRETNEGSLHYRNLQHRMLLVPDQVMRDLGTEGYRPYHYAFERLKVEIDRLGEAAETLKRYRREIEESGL